MRKLWLPDTCLSYIRHYLQCIVQIIFKLHNSLSPNVYSILFAFNVICVFDTHDCLSDTLCFMYMITPVSYCCVFDIACIWYSFKSCNAIAVRLTYFVFTHVFIRVIFVRDLCAVRQRVFADIYLPPIRHAQAQLFNIMYVYIEE